MAEDCVKCGGTGYIVVERDGMTGAERCSCFERDRSLRREERAGIPANFVAASFESFELPPDNPVARQALSKAFLDVRRYAETYPNCGKPGLLLLGLPGTGKTHLAIAAARTLMRRGFDVRFFDYQTLFDCIQRGWDQNAGTADKEAYQSALDAEILLLDDLGARRSIEWVEDTITAIITHRYNGRKPLIATSNLGDEAVGFTAAAASASGSSRAPRTLTEIIGERARSRLFEMCHVVKMPAVEDYRLRRRP